MTALEEFRKVPQEGGSPYWGHRHRSAVGQGMQASSGTLNRLLVLPVGTVNRLTLKEVLFDGHFAIVVRLEFELACGLICDSANSLFVSEMHRLDTKATHKATRLSAKTGANELLDGGCQVDRLVESSGTDYRKMSRGAYWTVEHDEPLTFTIS